MQFHKASGPLLALGLLFSCGGSGLGGPKAPAAGTLSLTLGADSIPGFSQVVVSVEKVEWTADGTNWKPLGAVKASYDLAALQNGKGAAGVLLSSVSLSPVTIRQFRITWATSHYPVDSHVAAYAVPTGGTDLPLTMPLTTEVTGPVVVPSNGVVQAQIMLSGEQAVQGRVSTSQPLSFQATGQAFDLAATARVTGHLGLGAANLAGVEVYAETISGTVASVQRRSVTDANGNYALEALPVGSLYYVVAQPTIGATAYKAKASAAINADKAMGYTADLVFDTPLATGTLALAITPASMAKEGTWVELRQTLPTGPDFQTFIVRSLTVNSGSTQDQVSFPGLATSSITPSTYNVRILRSVAGAAPVVKDGAVQQVMAGATTNYSLTYP